MQTKTLRKAFVNKKLLHIYQHATYQMSFWWTIHWSMGPLVCLVTTPSISILPFFHKCLCCYAVYRYLPSNQVDMFSRLIVPSAHSSSKCVPSSPPSTRITLDSLNRSKQPVPNCSDSRQTPLAVAFHFIIKNPNPAKPLPKLWIHCCLIVFDSYGPSK